MELTGHPRKRLPGHLSVIVRDTEGEDLVMSLDLVGVAASTGAACTTGSTEPSHVLTALGYPDEEARGSLRISLGRTTTDEEVDAAVADRSSSDQRPARLDGPDRVGRAG